MADFTPSRIGIGIGDMLTAPFVVAEMRKRTGAGGAFAESVAPVDEGGPHPGRYKAAFEVDSGVRRLKTRRAIGLLRNTLPRRLLRRGRHRQQRRAPRSPPRARGDGPVTR